MGGGGGGGGVGAIVYNRAIVYKRLNFFNTVGHVIIIDQCNQTSVRRHLGNGYLKFRRSCRCDVRVLLIMGNL